MSTNLAIIPVRTGSKRLPGKNLKEFHGKPIFIHALDKARDSGLFDLIHVSTESEEVVEICRTYNYDVDFLRPCELARDTSSLEDVIDFVLNEYKKKSVSITSLCLLWATAPLTEVNDIQEAYKLLKQHQNANAVVGITIYDLPVFCAQKVSDDGYLQPLFPDMMWLRSQDMPEVFCDNGSLAWVRVSAYKKFRTWMPPKSIGYSMPKNRSVDIDTMEDWERASYLYSLSRVK
jgi:N-acylneuraminate cytidylyltransferase